MSQISILCDVSKMALLGHSLPFRTPSKCGIFWIAASERAEIAVQDLTGRRHAIGAHHTVTVIQLELDLTMAAGKLIQFLIEKAEDIFLRAKYRRKDADKLEARGQELGAKAAEVFDVAQTQHADADKSEVLGQQFDAEADTQHEIAKTKHEEAAKTEMLAHELKAKSDSQYEIAKVHREVAHDAEKTGSELEAKAVEVETEIQREKKKNP